MTPYPHVIQFETRAREARAGATLAHERDTARRARAQGTQQGTTTAAQAEQERPLPRLTPFRPATHDR